MPDARGLDGSRRVVGHGEHALVVDERQLEDDGVGAGVDRLDRRAVLEIGAGGAGGGPDGVSGFGEEGGDRGTLGAGRAVDDDVHAGSLSTEAVAVPRKGCPIEHALLVLDGKWSTLIIRELLHGPRRFGELREALGIGSPKTLTERGHSFRSVLEAMAAWGNRDLGVDDEAA